MRILLSVLLLASVHVNAQQTGAPNKPESIFKRNTLYKSDSGFVRDVKLKGRYHGQYINQDEDIDGVKDNEYDVYHHRRARVQMDFKFDYKAVAAKGIAVDKEHNPEKIKSEG